MLPKPGDLINIDKGTPGVIIANQSNYSKSWGYMLINIDPDQHALVLEVYIPNALSNTEPPRKADEMLQAEQEKVCSKLSPNKRPPYESVPTGVLIMVVTLGEHIVELVWNPDTCSIISM
jgi:hypothetical protein